MDIPERFAEMSWEQVTDVMTNPQKYKVKLSELLTLVDIITQMANKANEASMSNDQRDTELRQKIERLEKIIQEKDGEIASLQDRLNRIFDIAE